MKKILCALLALALLLPLAACQSGGIDYLVLVNKENKLPDDWENKLETVTMTNSIGDEVEVEKKAYEAYTKLKEALAEEGVTVDLDSARRSVAEQRRIWNDFMDKYGEAYTKRTVATPGFSEHHTGLALDLYLIIDGVDVVENEDMIQYPEIWEKIHGKLAEYGFILRYLEGKEAVTGYGYEPWHIRYVNSPALAKEITQRGITLEEYLNKLPTGNVAPPAETEEPATEPATEPAAKPAGESAVKPAEESAEESAPESTPENAPENTPESVSEAGEEPAAEEGTD
ncbi:MAG: M15 family metallopeptidase [Clostridia bacterium]|nr:M15 family metallopeptidase [Clostridia bacterium]